MSQRIKHRATYLYDERYATSWSELWLKPGAPREVIDAVYRVLARRYHPESGGDPEAMQRLNAAYKQITGAA